jgi:hypothetical protein
MLRLWIVLPLILFFTFPLVAVAGERKLALIRQIQGTEQIPQELARQMDRITIQIVARQENVEILLSGNDTPTGSIVPIWAIESEVVRVGSTYKIESRILDLKSKKLINKALRDNIREEDLLRLFQAALESLFIPNKKRSKVPDQQESISQTQVTKLYDLPTLQISKLDSSQINFRQRVKDLKLAVDDEIIKVGYGSANSLIENKDKSPSQNQINPKIIILNSNTDLEVEYHIKPKPYKKKFDLSLGYETRSSQVSYLVKTSNNAVFINSKLQANILFPYLKEKFGSTFNLSYSGVTSSPVTLPPSYYAGAYLSWFERFWNFSIGLNHESFYFITLTTPGVGAQSNSISTLWAQIKNLVIFDLMGEWKFNTVLGIPTHVEPDNSSLNNNSWQGRQFLVSISPPLGTDKLKTQLSYESITLNNPGETKFILNDSRYMFSLTYAL